MLGDNDGLLTGLVAERTEGRLELAGSGAGWFHLKFSNKTVKFRISVEGVATRNGCPYRL